MKKIYNAPSTRAVAIQVRNHMLDLSAGNSASIKTGVTKSDAFGREDNGWDIWGSNDAEE